MNQFGAIISISPRDYDAVLFDLDGVLTRTASVHAAAWKKLFDDFLQRRAAETGEPFVPFDIEADYRRYVDGKPRYDGVAAFLSPAASNCRSARLKDNPEAPSVHALGKLKDQYFREQLEQHGVEVYESTICSRADAAGAGHQDRGRLVQQQLRGGAGGGGYRATVRRAGGRKRHRTISACRASRRRTAFLEGARRLKAEPSRAIVVEDAIAGVEAGRAGGFGMVIGVDRLGHSQALREAGADVVVTDPGTGPGGGGAAFGLVAGV